MKLARFEGGNPLANLLKNRPSRQLKLISVVWLQYGVEGLKRIAANCALIIQYDCADKGSAAVSTRAKSGPISTARAAGCGATRMPAASIAAILQAGSFRAVLTAMPDPQHNDLRFVHNVIDQILLRAQTKGKPPRATCRPLGKAQRGVLNARQRIVQRPRPTFTKFHTDRKPVSAMAGNIR